MVENSGTTLHADAIKLNMPEPVRVKEGPAGLPMAVITKGRQALAAIEDSWRIDDEWWRSEPVSRLYYALILASGQRLIVYKDMVVGSWYKQR